MAKFANIRYVHLSGLASSGNTLFPKPNHLQQSYLTTKTCNAGHNDHKKNRPLEYKLQALETSRELGASVGLGARIEEGVLLEVHVANAAAGADEEGNEDDECQPGCCLGGPLEGGINVFLAVSAYN